MSIEVEELLSKQEKLIDSQVARIERLEAQLAQTNDTLERQKKFNVEAFLAGIESGFEGGQFIVDQMVNRWSEFINWRIDALAKVIEKLEKRINDACPR